MTLVERFRAQFGRDPEGIWRAPGRVNLIGDHTDYADGFAFPFAIDRETRIAAARRTDAAIVVTSAERGAAEAVRLDEIRPRHGAWESYVLGVVAQLAARRPDPAGLDLAIASDVPVGAGLSSSAALACATAIAVADLYELELGRDELAEVARHAERDFAGVPCGVMDQLASMHGRAGHALLLDIRAHAIEPIPFPPAATVALVVDTGVTHDVGAGAYAERVASCDAAAAAFGVAALRDVDVALLHTIALDPVTARRARHVVTENDRVRCAADALRAGDAPRLGRLLLASHASLRDDHDVSCRELDVAVEAAVAAGALGARMTGAGFGGSIVALVPEARVDAVGEQVRAALRALGGPEPVLLRVVPADGASRLA